MLLTDAFLSDVAEHPNDDAPRLIFADWLDEQGESGRAEFIRLQCLRAGLPASAPEQDRLKLRESDLLSLHESSWRARLPSLEAVTWQDFRRGFVEAVCVDSADAFVTQAPAIFAAAPIQRVQIGRIEPNSGRRLAASPYLARMIELNLGNHTGLCRESLRSLAFSPRVEHLESLLLHYNDLGDEAIADLARSSHLPHLRELYLSGTEVGDLGAAALGDSGQMSHLIDLDLRDNRVGDKGARRLAFSLGLHQLSTLWLVNNHVGEAGAEALAWTERLPALANLYLNYNAIGNAGAEALAASPHRAGLIELDLRHCEIRDAGARALAASPYLEELQILWLGGNRLRSETLTLLRRRFGARLRI